MTQTAIYRPRGRAYEYAELALNLYKGCTHGCRYCYVPSMLRMTPEEFAATGVPRDGILEGLEKQLARVPRIVPEVMLSFSSDPYQPSEEQHRVTRRALKMLKAHGTRAAVLTKNPRRAISLDGDIIAGGWCRLGTTLVFDNNDWSLANEPGAPIAQKRIEALAQAHGMGIPTFVSCEPVVMPDQTLELMRRCAHVVDVFRVGTINHDRKLKNSIDWPQFFLQCKEMEPELEGIVIYKRDLLKCAGLDENTPEAQAIANWGRLDYDPRGPDYTWQKLGLGDSCPKGIKYAYARGDGL